MASAAVRQRPLLVRVAGRRWWRWHPERATLAFGSVGDGVPLDLAALTLELGVDAPPPLSRPIGIVDADSDDEIELDAVFVGTFRFRPPAWHWGWANRSLAAHPRTWSPVVALARAAPEAAFREPTFTTQERRAAGLALFIADRLGGCPLFAPVLDDPKRRLFFVVR